MRTSIAGGTASLGASRLTTISAQSDDGRRKKAKHTKGFHAQPFCPPDAGPGNGILAGGASAADFRRGH